MVLEARAGVLVDTGRIADFPLCTGATAALVPGRNYFAPAAEMFACGRGLVDPAGWPLVATAIAGSDGRLEVQVARSCSAQDVGCAAEPVTLTLAGTGAAVALADVDHDGRPEVITTGDGAPGDADRVTVYTIDGAAARRIYQRPFTGGVVALAAGDADGDGGDEVFAAARLLGSTQIDLWTLE
jgi:hypothetical protein